MLNLFVCLTEVTVRAGWLPACLPEGLITTNTL
jgi:hypothetical protein